MTFEPLSIHGAWRITPEPISDERGYFARAFCAREMEQHGLLACFPQCNLAWSHRAGTLRGLHYCAGDREEIKLLRCSRGSVQDVLLDLRSASPSYLQHVSIELSADNRITLYVPHGVAHGYLSLEDDTEMFYQMGDFFQGDRQCGVRWNDPLFGIQWSNPVRVISARDRDYSDYQVQKT